MIERLLRFAYVRRRLVLLAAVVLLAASLLLVTRLSFDANILKLLPRSGPAVRGFDAYLEHFGTIDQVYVLIDAPAGASDLRARDVHRRLRRGAAQGPGDRLR